MIRNTKTVFTCTTFEGHWPVGAAAIVLADSAEEAAELLNADLKKSGLKGDAEPKDMVPYPRTNEAVRVLCNGDY